MPSKSNRVGYGFGGGILGRAVGRAAEQRIRPAPDVRVPPLPDKLRTADRAIDAGRGRLRGLRAYANGGRIRGK